MKQQLVKIWARPNRNGDCYTFYLRYTDLNGKRKCESLGHSDRRKAEKQRAKKEKELRMRYCAPESMRFKDFVEDSLERTGNQIRESSKNEMRIVAKDFIKEIGNLDFRKITLDHGEYYRQVCFDRGNSPATILKKFRHLKRIFKLAVKRRQLDESPFEYIDLPKPRKKKIHIYSEDECARLLRAARDFVSDYDEKIVPRWDIMILIAIETGMRRGEIMNLCWGDIDFDSEEIIITAKENTKETWEWNIKDYENRTVPLSKYAILLLAELQSKSPANHPYVFVPIDRYKFIQKRRRIKKNWGLVCSRLDVLNNFTRHFKKIQTRAGIKKKGSFHDLRRTALSRWFQKANLTEFEVMNLAGHSSFTTTHSFYLALQKDHIDKARKANNEGLGKVLVGE